MHRPATENVSRWSLWHSLLLRYHHNPNIHLLLRFTRSAAIASNSFVRCVLLVLTRWNCRKTVLNAHTSVQYGTSVIYHGYEVNNARPYTLHNQAERGVACAKLSILTRSTSTMMRTCPISTEKIVAEACISQRWRTRLGA
jgi:hypothetical protein